MKKQQLFSGLSMGILLLGVCACKSDLQNPQQNEGKISNVKSAACFENHARNAKNRHQSFVNK